MPSPSGPIDPKPYRHKEWLECKERILAADGYRCQQCGKTRNDGAILQVHHKSYSENKKPWEYPPSELYTLCKGCHASIHGHIKPRFGWHYLGDNDLGDLTGTCENCGTEIRYEHYIQHPKWEPLTVGTDCCDNLTGTKLASNRMESIKRFASRKIRFLKSPKWKQYSSESRITHHGIEVVIAQKGKAFGITMNTAAGNKQFSSMVEAKTAAFEAIENGKAQAYLQKKGVVVKKLKRAKKTILLKQTVVIRANTY